MTDRERARWATKSRTATAKLQNYAIELGEALGQKQRLLDELKCTGNREQFLLERLKGTELNLALTDRERLAALERLWKAEADRDQFASCWTKAETALNDMEIAKNERVTTLEAALSAIAIKLGVITTQNSERITNDAVLVIDAKNQHIDRLEGDLERAENTWKNNVYLKELEAALEEARKALEPFAGYVQVLNGKQASKSDPDLDEYIFNDNHIIQEGLHGSRRLLIKAGDYRKAYAAHERIGRLMPEGKPDA